MTPREEFEKIWDGQQGAIFLKKENDALAYRKCLAKFFFEEGRWYGDSRGEKLNKLFIVALGELFSTTLNGMADNGEPLEWTNGSAIAGAIDVLDKYGGKVGKMYLELHKIVPDNKTGTDL